MLRVRHEFEGRSPVDMGALGEELIQTAVDVNATEEAHSEAAGRTPWSPRRAAAWPTTLNVVFSAPLSGFPLEVLDYTAERKILSLVFKEVRRDVTAHFDFATTDSLRTALSFGCGVSHLMCVNVDSKIQDAAAIAFTRAFYAISNAIQLTIIT